MARVLWARGFGGPIEGMVASMDAKGAPHLRHPRLVLGISIGGCADALGSPRKGAFRRKAHAHTSEGWPNAGWICFLSDKPERVITSSGNPTRTMWHEWAHIAAHTGHTARFRELLQKVGQPGAA